MLLLPRNDSSENGVAAHAHRITSYGEACSLPSSEMAKWDSIAGVRIVTSSLSLLGTLSVILSATVKRKVCNSKVQPTFVLSLADCLLAGLWLTGGILWAANLSSHSHIACLVISTATIILECITINLTLVYAFFALAHLKVNRLPSALFYPYQSQPVVCRPLKSLLIYSLAWCLPIVITLVLLISIVGASSNLINDIGRYSCWCMPGFANVLPIALAIDSATYQYNQSLKTLVLGYACVVFLHYLVVFPLLLATYCSTCHLIKTMRPTDKQSRLSGYYGTTEMNYLRGQCDAKHRVILYLLTFVILGLFNFLLSFLIIVVSSMEIGTSPVQQTLLSLSSLSSSITRSTVFRHTLFPLFLLQSVTVPLQGFINAIVYGWTRREFLAVLVSSSNLESQSQQEEGRGEGGYRTDSELHSSSYS